MRHFFMFMIMGGSVFFVGSILVVNLMLLGVSTFSKHDLSDDSCF